MSTFFSPATGNLVGKEEENSPQERKSPRYKEYPDTGLFCYRVMYI